MSTIELLQTHFELFHSKNKITSHSKNNTNLTQQPNPKANS
jgi:hypothetical protein